MRKIPVLKMWSSLLGNQEPCNKPYFDPPAKWVNQYLDNQELSIVQVGSNDGLTGDPIFKLVQKNKNWRVLFIEPVPYLFDRLKKNYNIESRFTFENSAINDGSYQTFYFVSEKAKEHIPNLPNWYDQLGSFYKKNIIKHMNGILKPFIEERKIKGMTLKQVFRKNNIDTLDMIHIDTEGYDWIVLSQLDLKKYSPTIILYEHKHLKKSEKKDSINFLKDKYAIYELGQDFLCINRYKLNSPVVLKGKLII